MLRHLIKLIWNKRGAHALLIIEIWASFMVLFGVLSLIVYNVKNYMRPIGFEYERVWNLDANFNQDTTALRGKMERVVQYIKSNPEVEMVTRMSSNAPFTANETGNSVSYKKVSCGGDFYYTDENFGKTLNLTTVEGRWYTPGDKVSKMLPVVINKKMKEKLFGTENPLGKILDGSSNGKSGFRVVGVVETFKAKGEFMTDKPALFQLVKDDDLWSTFLVKTKPGTDANFEAKLTKNLAAMVPGWGIEITYLSESRKNREKLTLVPVAIFLIVSGFLLTNVALGLFGILNLSIARRKNEIGLRRAMGATEGKVTIQFLGEIWVLAALSVLVGLMFAFQFPILNVFDIASDIYLVAIVCAVILIFLIVTLCAWWPSRQAARIHPALALHEE